MTINVVGAVIVKEGKIFAAQRPHDKSLGGFWEFPGGKIEKNETQKETLKREIREELSCEVEVGDFIVTSEYTYDFGTVSLSTYMCKLIGKEPTLNEHIAAKWLKIEELDSVIWAPADEETLDILKGK